MRERACIKRWAELVCVGCAVVFLVGESTVAGVEDAMDEFLAGGGVRETAFFDVNESSSAEMWDW